MALLLPAAVLHSRCPNDQLQNRNHYFFQPRAWSASTGFLAQWETGPGSFLKARTIQDRFLCNSNEGFAEVAAGSEDSSGAEADDDRNAEDCSQEFVEDKAGNPWLELAKTKPVTPDNKKSERTLNDALRKYLFISREGRKQHKWVDRRTAVLVVQNARNVETALTRVGDKLEVQDLNLLLRRFSNLERWDDACQLFEWMEKEERVSGVSYSTFIILLGKVGRINRAFYVYNTLSEELKLNPFIVNAMLSTLVNNWKVTRAFRLFRKLKESGFKPNHITYSTILCACLKIHNGYQKSQTILEDMKSRGMKPDAYAYGSLLRVYCANGLEDKAKAVVEEMRSEGVTLTLYHYSYLINLYARSKKPEEAEKIVSAIKESGLQPNEIVYRSLLNVYGCNGMLEQAKKTFYEIQATGMEPDMIMYSALMDAHVSAGKVYEAHEILVEMRRNGVRPGGNAYSILIWGYGNLGDFDMVNKLAAESRTRRIGKQDVRLYNALLKAYSQLKYDDGITNTLERMDVEGIMPNKGSFNILIQYLCLKRMFGLALRTYRDMKRRGLRPNAGTYSRLLTGLLNPLVEDRPQSRVSQILERTRERDIDLLTEAYAIFKEMQESEVCCHQPALERYIEVNALSKNWPVAIEALGEMKKARYKCDPLMMEALLTTAAEGNHYGVMSELMRQIKSENLSISPEALENVKQKFVLLDQPGNVLNAIN